MSLFLDVLKNPSINQLCETPHILSTSIYIVESAFIMNNIVCSYNLDRHYGDNILYTIQLQSSLPHNLDNSSYVYLQMMQLAITHSSDSHRL